MEKNRTPILYRENDKFIYEGDLGMKTNERQTSAKKKLIPAVAMLTASAVMLTTATYAWFTLNKEVEVKGLKMQATAGNSLEISLGTLGSETAAISANTKTQPGVKDDLSWKRAINIDDYYNVIGKLKPVSSTDALNLYLVSEDKVSAGGTKVEDSAAVTAATKDDLAKATLDTTYGTTNLTNDGDENEGYFIDIPMWIRSSDKTAENDVECKVTITDPTTGDDLGDDLLNAVRVAIIPVGSATNSTDINALKYDESTALISTASNGTLTGTGKNTATIFTLNQDLYAGKTYNEATTHAEARNGTPTYVDASKTTEDKYTPVFKMPKADSDEYAGVQLIARIWIEGESTHCNDATANQDWNIDFDFQILGGNS